jgi:hypothetical protein
MGTVYCYYRNTLPPQFYRVNGELTRFMGVRPISEPRDDWKISIVRNRCRGCRA